LAPPPPPFAIYIDVPLKEIVVSPPSLPEDGDVDEVAANPAPPLPTVME